MPASVRSPPRSVALRASGGRPRGSPRSDYPLVVCLPVISHTPSGEEATSFIERAAFIWHQRFELAPGVSTPGVNDVETLLERSGIPRDLTGARALDIGTTNGGAAFALERRGADVVAIDIMDESWFGFGALRELFGSETRFVQASVYELSERFTKQFDLVLFWGVLYHLRHPLLGLDNVRAVTGGRALLETAVADGTVGAGDTQQSLVRFFRSDELGGDGSNWFAPTIRALHDWCASSGFDTELLAAWPDGAPERCLIGLAPTPGRPEYQQISPERSIRCSVELGPQD
jgi:tRNA (mo5U34)-methyltransferase